MLKKENLGKFFKARLKWKESVVGRSKERGQMRQKSPAQNPLCLVRV